MTGCVAAFVETANLSEAAERSGVSRGRHYDWVRDPAYRRAFERAKEGAADRLEGEARRRSR
jgi:transposase